MRLILLTVLAVILSAAVLNSRADAATLAVRSTLAVAPTVRLVASICGTGGCAPVQTKRVRHNKPGTLAGHRI